MKLEDMPLGLVRCLGLLASWLIRGWMGTLSYRMDDRAAGRHPIDPALQRYIHAFWHETMLFGTLFPSKLHVLVSTHADGELIAQVCRALGFGVVRGSSRRGSNRALFELLQISEHSHLAITPDGPMGPRRKVQQGTIFLASRTGMPIIPWGVGYSRAWRARSWDRFALPLPYSSARCVGGAPITVPGDLDRNGLEYYRRRVEESLLLVTEDAERWASGKPRLSREASTCSQKTLAATA